MQNFEKYLLLQHVLQDFEFLPMLQEYYFQDVVEFLLVVFRSEIVHFDEWLKTHKNADEIRFLRQRAEQLKDDCLSKAMQQMAKPNLTTEQTEEIMQSLASCMCNKMIHGPTVEMRKALKMDDHNKINLIHSLIK